jgi:hypothetical protein
MDYREFFTSDNKSGIKTRESFILKNHPDLYDKITNHIQSLWYVNLSFKEKVWYFINNINEQITCGHCGALVKFKGNLNKGYGKYCSLNCANESGDLIKLAKESTINKYGVDSTNKLQSVKDKKIKTYVERYGVDNPMKSDIVKTKYKKSIVDNIGVDNPMKSDIVKTKYKKSIVDNYGVSNVFKNEDIKNQIKSTNFKNLGVEYPTQSKSVKDKIKVKSLNKLKDRFPFIQGVSGDILTCLCNKCNESFDISRILLNERYREGYELCSNCNPIGVKSISLAEKEIFEFVNSLGINVIENDTSVLNGKELDVYIPSHNLAIEYNGLYWHSELFKDKKYHLSKTEICESKEIKLIHIFEDEWLHKQDIVKSRIKNILGLTENKIYARKCEIKEVDSKTSKLFLENNHIQGFSKSKVKLGLYYNGELVSLMTFGLGRLIMGGKTDEWELIRFCNKLDTSVVGGASKLLKYFIKNYTPNKIISYADRRWSQGELYESLGFSFIHNSKPNYWYVNSDIREYRFKYRKSRLIDLGFDFNKSEKEIMLELKKYRIYDCGNKKYEFLTKL